MSAHPSTATTDRSRTPRVLAALRTALERRRGRGTPGAGDEPPRSLASPVYNSAQPVLWAEKVLYRPQAGEQVVRGGPSLSGPAGRRAPR